MPAEVHRIPSCRIGLYPTFERRFPFPEIFQVLPIMVVRRKDDLAIIATLDHEAASSENDATVVEL